MSKSSSNGTKDAKTVPAPWGEDDFIAALARLETMHNELTSVRLIPRQLIAPLSHPAASPGAINDAFTAAVADGSAQLDRLRRGWGDARAMRLIERCRASERRDADLAPGRDVPLWGWARRGGGATAVAEEEGAVDGEEQGGAGLDVAQEEALLDEIKADPAFGWSWADEGKAAVEIKIKGPGSNVAFQVTRRRGPDGVVYEAECLGDAKEKLVISRYLSRRPRKTDFRLLLNMLLSYKTLKSAKCVRCQRLLDDHGLMALARQPPATPVRRGNATDGTWEAVHESCIKSQDQGE